MPLFNTYIGDAEPKETSKTNEQEAEDQRLRRNIQWGIVRGLFLYALFMIPVALVLGLFISAMSQR